MLVLYGNLYGELGENVLSALCLSVHIMFPLAALDSSTFGR